MKNEKIIHLKVHQAVSFEKSLVTYFSEVGGPGRSSAKMTIIPDLQCVLVEGKTDKVLVPFVNTAFMKLESDFSKQAKKDKEDLLKKSSKPKSISSTEIKRPR